MQELSGTVGASGVSSVLLALVQIAYIPVFMAWALSWITGAGFELAAGEVHSPTAVHDSLLPLFPVVEMIPATTIGNWVVWIPILLGVACGVITGRSLRESPLVDAASRLLVAVLFFSFLIGVWFVLSHGALGAERMGSLGPVATAWPLLVLELAGTAALVALLVQPGTSRLVRSGVAVVKRGVSTSMSATADTTDQSTTEKSDEGGAADPDDEE